MSASLGKFNSFAELEEHIYQKLVEKYGRGQALEIVSEAMAEIKKSNGRTTAMAGLVNKI